MMGNGNAQPRQHPPTYRPSKTRSSPSMNRQAMELAQEHRTALISAAVTGKIDVRDFAPEETAC